MNPIGLPERKIESHNQDDDTSMIRWAYIKCLLIIGFGIAFIITGLLWLGNANTPFDNIAGNFGVGFGLFTIVLGTGMGSVTLLARRYSCNSSARHSFGEKK